MKERVIYSIVELILFQLLRGWPDYSDAKIDLSLICLPQREFLDCQSIQLLTPVFDLDLCRLPLYLIIHLCEVRSIE